MWIKLGIAAAALTYATVSLASVDYGQLYNEMYPVNGLKRGVLGLCQAAKPSFVRAIEQDRVDCYDSMPTGIERAIGWVRTSARLAALRTPTGVELAEKLLQQAELRQPFGIVQFAARAVPAGAPSCEQAAPTAAPAKELAAAESNDRLARRIANGDEKLLAELGIAKPGARSDTKQARELPVLPLVGSGVSGASTGAPAAAATGCQNPA